jgi:hypothetical protein
MKDQDQKEIVKLMRQYERSIQKLAAIDEVEPKLRAEALDLVEKTRGLDVELLILPPAPGDTVKDAMGATLKRLSEIRGTLELLPGIRAREEADLTQIELVLLDALDKEQSA